MGEEDPSGEDPMDSLSGSPGPPGFPLTILDASGETLVLNSPPRRIVCLVPSGSETLLRLGASELLVGRTDFDTLSALAHLPSVGGGLNPNLEALIALEPDLVIRFSGESDPSTPGALGQMGILHMAIRPSSVADVRKIIRDLGEITARKDAAASLLDAMEATLEEVRARVQDRPKVRVGYILGGTPPWVAGPGSYIEELLEIAGGENVFFDLEVLFGPVNAEVFLVRPIDLLLAAEGADVSIPESVAPLRRVSPSLEIPGPDLASAALELARILHPEAFQ
jgi:iron complex transport system substrate-binding protein